MSARSDAEVALRVIEAVLGDDLPLWHRADEAFLAIESVLGRLPERDVFAELIDMIRSTDGTEEGHYSIRITQVRRIRRALDRREGRAL